MNNNIRKAFAILCCTRMPRITNRWGLNFVLILFDLILNILLRSDPSNWREWKQSSVLKPAQVFFKTAWSVFVWVVGRGGYLVTLVLLESDNR